MTVFPFHMLHFLVPQSRENKKIFDVFLLTLFIHLVPTTASNNQTHPASEEGLCLTVSSKDSTGNEVEMIREEAGMVGEEDKSDGLLSDPQEEGSKQISSAGTFLPRNNLGHPF